VVGDNFGFQSLVCTFCLETNGKISLDKSILTIDHHTVRFFVSEIEAKCDFRERMIFTVITVQNFKILTFGLVRRRLDHVKGLGHYYGSHSLAS
jgi:hypothetical protein